MKIGIFGTGMVGQTIGSKLVQNGHEVKMGSRTADNAKAAAWVTTNGANASQGTYADAAAFGEVLFNCTAGNASLEVLNAAGAEHLDGKLLLDISNSLDFSKGMPPTLSVCNTDSIGEQLQRAFPKLMVVKTLNTLNCNLMVNPGALAGAEHDVFVSGNDAVAKNAVVNLLKLEFGWKNVVDLGDITSARGVEMYLPLWLRMYGAVGSPNFNIKIVR